MINGVWNHLQLLQQVSPKKILTSLISEVKSLLQFLAAEISANAANEIIFASRIDPSHGSTLRALDYVRNYQFRRRSHHFNQHLFGLRNYASKSKETLDEAQESSVDNPATIATSTQDKPSNAVWILDWHQREESRNSTRLLLFFISSLSAASQRN